MKWVCDNLRIPIRSWCQEVEKDAFEQAKNLAELSVTYGHIALMPDCHVGYGMPIGGVIGCWNAVIPNAVGVDIGCGVCAVRTDFPAGDMNEARIKRILGKTREYVPVGFDHHKRPQEWDGWADAPLDCPPVRNELESAKKQLGTLGGGNHFIEIQAGDDGHLWLMVHSGSRNFGLKIAEHYHRSAVNYCERKKVIVPVKDLAYFHADSELGEDYLRAMNYALKFAARNRESIMEQFLRAVSNELKCERKQVINIHHNYCAEEEHFGRKLMVHRKGATSAFKGQWGIIPGSMGTSSYIVKGQGNTESFMSCSHGAGRKMGRNAACKNLSVEECNRAMDGIVFGRWSRDRKGNLDLSEAPQAYKDIDEVIEAQTDLVEVITKLRPLGVIKG